MRSEGWGIGRVRNWLAPMKDTVKRSARVPWSRWRFGIDGFMMSSSGFKFACCPKTTQGRAEIGVLAGGAVTLSRRPDVARVSVSGAVCPTWRSYLTDTTDGEFLDDRGRRERG